MAERKSRKPTRKVARSSSRASNRASSRGTARKSRVEIPRTASPPEPPLVPRQLSLPPHELYRHEKRRRADQPRADGRDPLEEARREFKAMLEAGIGTPRGGRPRKVKPQPEDDDA